MLKILYRTVLYCYAKQGKSSPSFLNLNKKMYTSKQTCYGANPSKDNHMNLREIRGMKCNAYGMPFFGFGLDENPSRLACISLLNPAPHYELPQSASILKLWQRRIRIVK